MSVVVVATITPLEGQREAVTDALVAAVERVHAEDDGCLLYALHETADALVMVEKWADPESLRAHSTSPASRELGAALDGLLVQAPVITVLEPHPAGTEEQGAL